MAGEDSSVEVTAADKGKTVEIRRGDKVDIKLEENATTGYRWAIDKMDEEVLELESSDFATAPDIGIGGGGERRFSFKAKGTGTARVELKLWREWEGDASVIDRYDLTIRVE